MMRNYLRPVWDWWESVNARFGSLLMAFLFAVCALTLVAIFFQIRTNDAQDKAFQADQRARVADQAALLECFDQYATALSGSLPPVRDASAKRDLARDVYDKALLATLTGKDGLGGLLLRAQQGKPNTPEVDLATLVKTFGVLDAKAEALDVASAALVKARAENPYPEPPSKFCDLPTH